MKPIMHIMLISNFICLHLPSRITAALNEIKQEIGAQRFSTISPTQQERISNMIKTMTSNQKARFFDSFNYHYTAINNSRKRDTVTINLATISYHNPDKITEDDINKIIKLAHKHAMTPANHCHCAMCG